MGDFLKFATRILRGGQRGHVESGGCLSRPRGSRECGFETCSYNDSELI